MPESREATNKTQIDPEKLPFEDDCRTLYTSKGFPLRPRQQQKNPIPNYEELRFRGVKPKLETRTWRGRPIKTKEVPLDTKIDRDPLRRKAHSNWKLHWRWAAVRKSERHLNKARTRANASCQKTHWASLEPKGLSFTRLPTSPIMQVKQELNVSHKLQTVFLTKSIATESKTFLLLLQGVP